MELVEGDDLSQRIARGAIPIDEALPVATQIAEALEAAHEQGIIHRDLKPANIKVRSDGTVKVLDFGLAKAMEPAAGSSPSMSMAPTITTPAMMTGVGMILGTAAYMSPEQAKGRTVDRRADVWAFGAVLFEMLTGQRAFGGDDVSEVLSRVLQREPEWAALPSGLSSTLVVYLKRCLHKDLKQRIGDMHDVRLALEGAFETAPPQTTAAATPAASRGRLVWMAALVVAALGMVAMAVPTVRHLREAPPPAPPETRVEINTPATGRPASFALSPDGRQIVFVASGDGVSRLWIRSLATTTAQPLAGTEGATAPFWSPDSRFVGFFATAALKRLDLGGGVPQTLAPVTSGGGGTWNADGVIVFSSGLTTALTRVSATGGAATPLTTLGPGQRNHRHPWFLPDGRRFLFLATGAADAAGIYLSALDGGAPTRLAAADGSGVYLPSGLGRTDANGEGGWLLWVRAGALVAQRLDVAKAALTGEPVTLAEAVAVEAIFSQSAVSVADTGLVAYRMGGGGSGNSPGWTGRAQRGARSTTRIEVSTTPACLPTAGGWRCNARWGTTRTSGWWTVAARAASRLMLMSMFVPAGRPTALGSRLHRAGRGRWTFTRSSRAAMAWTSASWRLTRSRPRAVGRRTVGSCCSTAPTRRRTSTCGSCRWWAIARRRCS
jgi:hypothetical protein